MRAANYILFRFAGKLTYKLLKRGHIKSFNISYIISVWQNRFQFPGLSCDFQHMKHEVLCNANNKE